MHPEVVSKTDFARLMNVTPTRVGQWLREGKITPDALDGVGRRARIRVATARAQLKDRLDISQRFGNGINTRLDFGAASALRGPEEGVAANAVRGDTRTAPEPRVSNDPVADQIKQERFRALQYANRRAAEEERARAGLYVRADQTSAAMAKMAGAIINVVEGGLSDLAQGLAAKFELPARDVLHLLRTEFRQVRVKAADAARRHVETLPAALEDVVADASDPAIGEA